MAQKRMFDKRVVGTDKFMDLPMSAKALYFLAGMEADDKGFFEPKKLQKIYGFSEDDFKILVAKQYVIIFDTGVMVITDWNKNNWLDSRRIQETEYIDELRLLKIINEKYELEMSAKQMLSEYSIEENRIEEYSIEQNNKQKQVKVVEKNVEIFDFIETNMGRTITPYEYEFINDSVDIYGLDIVLYAYKKAFEADKKSMNYVKGILRSWKQDNLTTLEMIKSSNENKKKGNKQGMVYEVV